MYKNPKIYETNKNTYVNSLQCQFIHVDLIHDNNLRHFLQNSFYKILDKQFQIELTLREPFEDNTIPIDLLTLNSIIDTTKVELVVKFA